ncbi:MAG: transcriptional regulator [Desulfobulbus sp.]|nr:transcriptional regulator [Desulfobulbus sp.]
MKNQLHPIRTEADYRAALKTAEAFFDADEEPDPDSIDGAYFEALVTLIEAYEKKHYPIAPPDPIAAIKFRMEQAGLSVADLTPYIGQKNRVYEVLNGKRKLTLAMIRKLVTLGIPAASLVAAE